MAKFRNVFRIESARLKEWDYSNPWWYYITVNTKGHKFYFGEIIDGEMYQNQLGEILKKCWIDIPKHFQNAELDYYVIMPNHLHGIIILNESGKDVACNVSTDNKYSEISPKPGSLSTIIRSLKSEVTREIHRIGYHDFNWQPRFYDRIIRNEKELYKIRNYIEKNPLKWFLEKENSENICDI